MQTGGRCVSPVPIMPSLRTTWFLEQLVTFEPLEPFSGSVNYIMADQRRAITLRPSKASISRASQGTQVDTDIICHVLYDIACDILPQYHDRIAFA